MTQRNRLEIDRILILNEFKPQFIQKTTLWTSKAKENFLNHRTKNSLLTFQIQIKFYTSLEKSLMLYCHTTYFGDHCKGIKKQKLKGL